MTLAPDGEQMNFIVRWTKTFALGGTVKSHDANGSNHLSKYQWNEAFAEWLPDLIMDLDTQVVVKGSDHVPSNRKVVITTYDLFSKTVKDRLGFDFGMCCRSHF